MKDNRQILYDKICWVGKWLLILTLMLLPALSNLALVQAKIGDTHTVKTTDAYGEWTLQTEPAGLAFGSQGYITVDGQAAFCLEPEKTAHSGANQEIAWSAVGIDEAMMKKLTRIAYYGYRIQPNMTNYFMTQNLIWQTLMAGKSWQLYCVGGKYQSLDDMQNWFDDVLEKVDRFNLAPSFNGLTYQMKVGETLNLKDTKGVLKDCRILDADGFDVTISDQTLVIKAEKNSPESGTITLTKDDAVTDGSQTFVVKNGNSQAVSFLIGKDAFYANVNIEVEKYGSLKLRKINQEGTLLSGAIFKITGPSFKNGKEFTVDKELVLEDLLPGEYTVQEVKAPDGYLIQIKPQHIEVVSSQMAVCTISDQQPTGSFELVKKNEDQSAVISDVHYRLWNDFGGQWELITDDTGLLKIDGLPLGHYYYQETKSGEGYLLDSTIHEFDLKFADEHTACVEVSRIETNREPLGRILLKKKDRETSGAAQGDASLGGAIYVLYAKENIQNRAKTKLFYQKDEEVARVESSDNGEFEAIDHLPLGQYYLKEIQAPNGYLLDTKIYDIDLHYQDEKTALVELSLSLPEQVKKQAFEIVKFSSDGSSGIVEGLAGAEFTVKLKSEVDQVGFEKAKCYDILTTDRHGQATSVELPFGTYIVKETVVPSNHLKVEDFTVCIQEDSRIPLPLMLLNDAPYESYLRIVKKDQESGRTILLAGASFKIKNLDTGEYVKQKIGFLNYQTTFTTDKTGTVSTPLKLASGHYQIEEIQAPQGYCLNPDPVPFEINDSGAVVVDKDGDPVLIVAFSDRSIKGKISIYKEGEVLTDYRHGIFIYEKHRLGNAEYDVYAAEDIYSADQHKQLLYAKNQRVAHIQTDENGIAETDLLPLGTYEIEEIVAPKGYVLNNKRIQVVLDEENQSIEVVSQSLQLENERQQLTLQVLKQDADTSAPIVGAKFGLYAKEDILAHNGDVLVQAGTFLESAESDGKGFVQFKADLPLGKYWIQEIEAPLGYVKQDEKWEIDTTDDDCQDAVISYQKVFKNQRTRVEISKQDVTTSKELPGASLEVRDESGKLIDRWISGDQPHMIQGLCVGQSYTLRETAHPYGFALSQEIEFEVKNEIGVQKVTMIDELKTGKVSFTKIGRVLTGFKKEQTDFGIAHLPIYEEQRLCDAEITIYAAEDIQLANGMLYYQADTPIETLKSDEQVVYSKALPVGHYYALETSVPIGYVQDFSRYDFEIKNDGVTELEIVPISILNERAKVHLNLSKTLEQGIFPRDTAYQKVKFGIFTQSAIKNNSGDLLLEKDKLIAVCGIDQNGRLREVPDLPIANYYLKELVTDDNYVLDEQRYPFTVEYQGKDVLEYTIDINNGNSIENELKRGQIELVKVDKQNRQRLSQAIFGLYDCEGNLLSKIMSNKQGQVLFDYLEYGQYIIREISAPKGYIKQEQAITVTLNDHNQSIRQTVTNTKQPILNTGDQLNISYYMKCLLVVGIIVMISIIGKVFIHMKS